MNGFIKVTTKRYEPIWVKPDYCTYDEAFVLIRSEFQYKGNECVKCDRKFVLGESIGIASFKGIGNKLVCDACAKEMML